MTSPRFGAAILGCAGPDLRADERAFFGDVQPFGFILFARNIDTGDRLRALTTDLREAVGWNAPVFIDQEGGRVQRLRAPLVTEMPPPLDHAAALGPNGARGFYLRYRIIAEELRSYGIDGNCAPMLDIARPETHAFLRNRCYGETLESVVAHGNATRAAHLDAGVLPVMKHMPGHGLGTLDSHLEVPRVSATRAALDTKDFAAFRAFNDMTLGMTGHLVFEDIDPSAPSTVSPIINRLIREDIGFTGFLMTDDISMEALDGTVATRGAAALAAGCDAVLHCNGKMPEMQSLMDNVGEMSDTAQARAEAALATRPSPHPVDMAALADELWSLTA